MLTVAMDIIHWEREDVKGQFDAFSAVCLYLGPTPNASLEYNDAFAVPGFCESLNCYYVTERNVCVPFDAVDHDFAQELQTHINVSPWVRLLSQDCRRMLQKSATTTYMV